MLKIFGAFAVAFSLGFAQDRSPSSVPEKLRVPAAQKLLFEAHGKGDQIYTCNAAQGELAWTLKGPDAELFSNDGQLIGRHFAGPTWEAKDGSRVAGKVAASVPAPAPDSVPWLLLSATEHEGNGRMSGVVSIQRLSTKGGKAPANGCDDSHIGQEMQVPYQADYYFYVRIK